jgi:WD40 repeat protein
MISSLYRQNQNTAQPLSGENFAAKSQKSEIVIRKVPNLSVNMICSGPDTVHDIKWNCNGTMILGSFPSQNEVRVWALADSEWSSILHMGAGGLSRAAWHPSNPTHLFLFSEFDTKMEIWDLAKSSQFIVPDVTSSVGIVESNSKTQGIVFSSISRSVRVLDLRPSEYPKIIHEFTIEKGPSELAGARWNSDDRGFVAWGSPLESRLFHYDLKGTLISEIDLYSSIPDSITSRPLGVSCVAYNRDVLFVGTYNSTVQILSLRGSLSVLAEFSLNETTLIVIDDLPNVYRESLGGSSTVMERNLFHVGGSVAGNYPVQYRAVIPEESPKIEGLSTLSIPLSDPIRLGVETDKSDPPSWGVTQLVVSTDGRYLSCVSQRRPSVAFIYDLAQLRLSVVLIHRLPIMNLSWSPVDVRPTSRLCITTGDSRIFIWSATECGNVIEMKEKAFKPTISTWAANGRCLLLSDEKQTCCVTLEDEYVTIGG